MPILFIILSVTIFILIRKSKLPNMQKNIITAAHVALTFGIMALSLKYGSKEGMTGLVTSSADKIVHGSFVDYLRIFLGITLTVLILILVLMKKGGKKNEKQKQQKKKLVVFKTSSFGARIKEKAERILRKIRQATGAGKAESENIRYTKDKKSAAAAIKIMMENIKSRETKKSIEEKIYMKKVNDKKNQMITDLKEAYKNEHETN
jgi:predicted permease